MENYQPLSSMKPGESGIIDRFIGNNSALLRLQEMGLLPGTPVEFIRKAPMGDPLEIRLRGYHLSLRKAEATAVAIKPA